MFSESIRAFSKVHHWRDHFCSLPYSVPPALPFPKKTRWYSIVHLFSPTGKAILSFPSSDLPSSPSSSLSRMEVAHCAHPCLSFSLLIMRTIDDTEAEKGIDQYNYRFRHGTVCIECLWDRTFSSHSDSSLFHSCDRKHWLPEIKKVWRLEWGFDWWIMRLF